MIPKIIHYCWFGGNEKSDLIKRCIESWRRYAPDFQIIEWNEKNFDVNKYKYSQQAYGIKKYAFVSDVARFDILYNEGGIYLDTDVELIKSIDVFLDNRLFMGYDQKGLVASGLIMGAEKGQQIVDNVLSFYRNNDFILKNGRPNTTTVVTIVSDILKNNGIELNGVKYSSNNIVIYPSSFFDPYDYESNKMQITDDTCSVHHYASSWKDENDFRVYKIGRIIKKIVGRRIYDRLARLKHHIMG